VIIDIGSQHPGLTLSAAADLAREEVFTTARRLFAGELADFLAARFLARLTAGGGDLEAAADAARAVIIDIARRPSDGIQLVTGAGRAVIIDIGRRQETAKAQVASRHLVRLEVRVTAAAPWVPERPVRLLTSDAGRHLAAAWDTESAVKYRQLGADGAWSDIRTVTLGPQLSAERGYELIQQQLQQN
jgi:hypothetical protein